LRFWEDEDGDADIISVVSCLTIAKVGVTGRGGLELEERVTRLVPCRAISSVAFRLATLEDESCSRGFSVAWVVCTAEAVAFGDSNAYF